MEGLVVRVAEAEVSEAFVFGDEAVADDLDLRLVGCRDSVSSFFEEEERSEINIRIVFRSGCKIERLASMVLPWP